MVDLGIREYAMIGSMAKMVRLRSVDTNPIFLPSRFWTTDVIGIHAGDDGRFAKYATVVTEVYTAYLEAGLPVPARTSWARFVPTNQRGPRRFSGHPMTQDLGLGEVHEVPYDPDVLNLPDEQRRLAILNWLQDNLLALAASLHWPIEPFDIAYRATLRDRCRFHRIGVAKSSPSRRHKAHVEYEVDANGDAWSWAVITASDGQEVITSDRYDAFPAAQPLRQASRSIRWEGSAVTWTPWAYPSVPRNHQELARAQELHMP